MYKRDFIHEVRWAIAHAALPPKHETLLGKLLVFANGKAGNTFPPQKRLAKMCGCSERTIERLMSHLKKAGWVTVEKKACSAGLANVYRVHIGRRFKAPDNRFEFIDEIDWSEDEEPPKRDFKDSTDNDPDEF